ncbi:MAG: DNA gyrase subunit A [Bifidobacterium breve]
MRAVVNTEEIKGRMCLVVTELPYQVQRTAWSCPSARACATARSRAADMRDETSGRTGQRLVLVLKRDAVPKVAQQPVQALPAAAFGANMLRWSTACPRAGLDAFIRHWVSHQLDVIERRTATSSARPRSATTFCRAI